MSNLLPGFEPSKSAVISPCGLYRYRLYRHWAPDKPQVMFVMLNPSTADAETDDPTVRRCIGYAKRWGFGSLAVGNLFAWRATNPLELYNIDQPVGPENDDHLMAMANESSLIVAAWGVRGKLFGREAKVRELMPEMKALQLLAGGVPGHPLYLPGDLNPIEWKARP